LPQLITTARSSDHDVARSIASEAGRLLLALRQECPGAAPAKMGAEGDGRSHDAIVRRLADLRPGDAVLSEEAPSDPGRLRASRVWVVDPLDGTREFGEGRGDWAIHVALVVDGQPVAAAVALPALGSVLATRPAPPPVPPGGERVRIVVSRTRAPEVAERLRTELEADIVPMGSAGAKVAAVVCGRADVYVHDGGQYEWDSAAPVAVARAAGLHASRLDGSPLVFNRADPWLPDLLVCRRELAPAVLDVTQLRV
jgi:3'(2'), 5'-bisphosphate nucleotidase